jgi:hypothetical protein
MGVTAQFHALTVMRPGKWEWYKGILYTPSTRATCPAYHNLLFLRFEVLMAVNVKITFRRNLLSTLKMEAASSFKTLIHIYRTEWCHWRPWSPFISFFLGLIIFFNTLVLFARRQIQIPGSFHFKPSSCCNRAHYVRSPLCPCLCLPRVLGAYSQGNYFVCEKHPPDLSTNEGTGNGRVAPSC